MCIWIWIGLKMIAYAEMVTIGILKVTGSKGKQDRWVLSI